MRQVIARYMILALGLFGQRVVALEVYSFVDGDCKAHTGFIIDADVTNVTLLTQAGHLATIDRGTTNSILVYNVIHNPIAAIHVSPQLLGITRDVFINSQSEPSLTGWPTQFVGEMMVFLDIYGKANLIDQDKLLGIQPTSSEILSKSPLEITNSKLTTFGFGHYLPGCKNEQADQDAVQPTRLLSDKIKIHEFLARYETGFVKLKKFQNRTKFYAKPFLFDQESRVGFVYTKDTLNREMHMGVLPFYFQWSSGRPYSHQGVSSIGYKQIPWLPNVEPIFGVQSELKVHFFSASLAGNLVALPAGKSLVVANKPSFSGFFKNLPQNHMGVYTNFNYLAMSGLDYGPHSWAVGVLYPIVGIYADGYFREVLANTSSLVVRYTHTTSKTKWKIMGSSWENSQSQPDETQIQIASDAAMQSGVGAGVGTNGGVQPSPPLMVGNFRLKALFLRGGIEHALNQSVRAGLDLVVFNGEYSEKFLDTDGKVEFRQNTLSGGISQQFGNYVALKGQINIFGRDIRGRFAGVSTGQNDNQYSGSMTIDFIL